MDTYEQNGCLRKKENYKRNEIDKSTTKKDKSYNGTLGHIVFCFIIS